MSNRKSYAVHVECANCAAKIEAAARAIDGVRDASLSFMTQRLRVTFEDDADESSVLSLLVRQGQKVERGFEIISSKDTEL